MILLDLREGLDNDGNKDLVATAFLSNDLLYWENDGNGNFGSTQIVDSEITGDYDVKIVDVNEYGQQDIVISYGFGLLWFRNDLPLFIKETVAQNNLKIYPNPTSEHVFIESKALINKIQLFNTLEELIFTYNVNTLSTNLYIKQSGLYFIQIKRLM